MVIRGEVRRRKSEAFFADCKRLALGEPLAYLIGHTPFLGCKICLDSKPLIPRPETEFWTEEAIKVIKGRETLSLGLGKVPPRILDLCAGSGCIGIAVAKAIPEARVDFSEIDARLLPTIRKNLEENNISEDRYNIFHTSLFGGLTGKYDFILSNPPYIDPSLNRTEESVRKHEPYVALFGGEKGMEVITEIINQTSSYIEPTGQLWLEHEPEQSALIMELGHKNNFSVTTHKDQYGIERYSILVLQ